MKINSYSFGKIIVEGKKYTKDLKIFPEGVKSKWWRESGHNLSKSDITDILEYEPDVLYIGTGKNGRMTVNKKLQKEIKENGIEEVYVYKTDKAVKAYNKEEKENKVAAFHLTC